MARRTIKHAKPGSAKREQAPRRAPDATTREAIAAAALELFSAHGFASVSNKELGKAAGVNPALIYYYFADKQGLFTFVVRKALADAEAVYEARRRDKGSLTSSRASSRWSSTMRSRRRGAPKPTRPSRASTSASWRF
jgi:AcrR family transcriptional regulator